ncbi:MAG: hypothetical protein IM627_11365 [Cytophagales bacterium]|nr:hypothetical protein [Cytophagales bacterium]
MGTIAKKDKVTMTGEFRTAKGWRIFIYIFSPLLIGLFSIGGFMVLNSDSSNLTVNLILIPISLGGTIMFTYGLIETIVGKLIVEKDSVSIKSSFGTRTLYFQEIKGFRIGENYIQVVSNTKSKKSIKLALYIEKSDQLADWLANNFVELDSHEAKQEELQILTNHEFGINAHTREHKLSEARKVAKYINIIGGLTCAWLWFYPRPYPFSLSVGMIIPALAFISLYVYRGLIRFDEKKNSAHPSIIYGFALPSAGLLIRAVMDYEILEFKSLWIAISFSTITLTLLFIIGTKEIKFKKFIDYFTAFALAAIVLCYSFGTYVISNCLFDKSEPEIFKSEVTDKEISSGKSTSYYLKLQPWGPRTEIERVSVTQDEYEATDKGDTVDIYLRQGLLKTPWFYVVTE